MNRLITQEMLEKYLIKERTVNDKRYETIFEYSGVPVVDNAGTEIAHEVIVGFKDEKGRTETGKLYLPIALGNGLLTRNKTTWYSVHMVIPPVRFYGTRGKSVYCLNELVSTSMDASSLDDFFPEIFSMKTGEKTPLYQELLPERPMDVSNLYNWNILRVELALIELFNIKIARDIVRSQRGGFSGISASIRALHTLCRAFCRFNEDEDESRQFADSFAVIPEEMQLLGSIRIEDKYNAVLVHGLVKKIQLAGDSPIDFCSCSQAQPIRTGRLKDGVTVEGARFAGKPVFPYTRWRRGVVGITSDDPRRVIVSRSITRALRLDSPDEPYALTDVVLDVDSLSLPGIRITHPLTHEDSMVVSETFASKAGAYKLHVEKISVPVSADVQVLKEPYTGSDVRDLVKRISRSRDDGHYAENNQVINRGDVLLTLTYTDMSGESITQEIRTNCKTTGMVTAIEAFTPATDLEDTSQTFRFVSLLYYPLEVGDKIADAHGNKATVSAIWSDVVMPRWESSDGEYITIHSIGSPFIMKRLAVGAEIEDKCALVNYTREKRAMRDETAEYEMDIIDSLEPYTLADADALLREEGVSYTGTVTLAGQTYTDVPLCLRRLFRLDNNVRDTVNSRHEVVLNAYKRTSKNARMGIDIVTMLTRGANVLVNWLIQESGSSYAVKHTLIPLLHGLLDSIPPGAKSFRITKKLERTLLGNPYSAEAFASVDLADTVCDPRLAQGQYGYMYLGKGKKIVIPPHEALTESGNGTLTVSKIAVIANRVLSEQHSYNQGYHDKTNVPRQVERYHALLSSLLTGKNGCIRDVVFPVFPVSLRSVATAWMSDTPLEIRVPQAEFHRLMRKHPQFRALYQDKQNWYCILKRDPVHTERNLFTVRFRLWKYKSIGISPLLINTLDADYDGDTVFALFPTDRDAFRDALKLLPSFAAVYAPTKHIADTTAENAVNAIQERTGWTSTFHSPHASDVVKNPELCGKLTRGISFDALNAECIAAARDFEVIKDGTAQSGALGLSFILSRKPDETHLLSAAMELYHLLAQGTLDAKAGVSVPALRVIASARKGDHAALIRALDELGFTDKPCREAFLEFTTVVRETGGRVQFLTNEFPVLAAIQRGASSTQARAAAHGCLKQASCGLGIWEVMMDYLLLRADASPYAWKERETILAERIRQFRESLKQTFHG